MQPQIHRLTAAKPAGTPPLFRQELLRHEQYDLNVVQVAPGAGKEPHPDPSGDAVMLILEGGMTLEVDGASYPLAPGDIAIIPRGATRSFTAGSAGATFFAAHLCG